MGTCQPVLRKPRVLQRGQTAELVSIQELIQNADDAGAKVVRFYIDGRQHPSDKLHDPDLAEYQGPALIAANDAVFTEKDWEGIQRLQDSIKAEDPFNVGKFGIGFNAVYHITGML